MSAHRHHPLRLTGLVTLPALMLIGCAGPSQLVQDRQDLLPPIDIIQLRDDATAALAAAQQLKQQMATLETALHELETRVGSESGAGGEVESLRERIGELETAVRQLQTRAGAAANPSGATGLPASGGSGNTEPPVQAAPSPQPAGAQPMVRAASAEPEPAMYQRGLEAFNSRDYRKALDLFAQTAAAYPSGAYVDNSLYWSGECYYALGDFETAMSAFRKVLGYASSNKCDDARLKLGLCCMKLGRRSEARSHFEALIRDYPSSEYAGRARSYLEQL